MDVPVRIVTHEVRSNWPFFIILSTVLGNHKDVHTYISCPVPQKIMRNGRIRARGGRLDTFQA